MNWSERCLWKDLSAIRLVRVLALSSVVAMAAQNTAIAQDDSPQARLRGPTASAVVNLIRALVQEGVLTQDKAQTLIRQAEDEAAVAARSQQEPSALPASTAEVQSSTTATSVRVPYIPKIVRKQIKDELKDEVLQEARSENWAAPNAIPEWTKHFHLDGDFRFRYEWDIFDSRNSNTFPNFAALDAGSPFDLNNSAGTPPPILDTTENRQRMRIRARLGIGIDIADGFVAGIRLATGNTTNPVSTNQTLGTTLNKDSFVLDRAFLKYRPADWATISVGRFANPWLYTDLVWDDDIAFDGIAAQFNPELSKNLSILTTAGAFPIENTPFSFPDNTIFKTGRRDKWLFAAQGGFDWQPRQGYDFKLAAAYYHFRNLEGQRSDPCVANSSADPCDTDNSRPGFLQQGNTLFAIRNLVSSVTNPPVFQYYGLATPFHEMDVTARFDISRLGDIHIVFDGDVVKNLAFSSRGVAARNPVNNIGPDKMSWTTPIPGTYDGGSLGYQVRATVGYPEVRERWQWNLSAAYKYLQSDAVPDAFTDSDFHLGGTNAKGYIIGATLGVAHNINVAARWSSASEVTGMPYTVDVVQVDVNARF